MTEYVIWDWNGTLLDDVDFNRRATNQLLVREGIPEIPTLERYRELFGFPTEDYYKRAGFDFNKTPYSSLADDYSAIYWASASKECSLSNTALDTLKKLDSLGIPQMILSLSRQDKLDKIVDDFALRRFIRHDAGSADFLAVSKEKIAVMWADRLKNEGFNPKNALYIGDTRHDFDVSLALGCRCLLYSGGHESRAKLLTAGCPVINNINDVLNYL